MTSPLELLTLSVTKQHLSVTHTDQDDLITLYIQMATDTILTYLKHPDESLDWTVTNLPPAIKGAILMQVAEFWAKRGDEGDVTYAANATSRAADGWLTPNITRLVNLYRDSSFA